VTPRWLISRSSMTWHPVRSGREENYSPPGVRPKTANCFSHRAISSRSRVLALTFPPSKTITVFCLNAASLLCSNKERRESRRSASTTSRKSSYLTRPTDQGCLFPLVIGVGISEAIPTPSCRQSEDSRSKRAQTEKRDKGSGTNCCTLVTETRLPVPRRMFRLRSGISDVAHPPAVC
jgi:hypothetical protein